MDNKEDLLPDNLITPCKTADELLKELNALNHTGGWHFRGHGNTEWDLRPSAWRESVDKPLKSLKKYFGNEEPENIKNKIDHFFSEKNFTKLNKTNFKNWLIAITYENNSLWEFQKNVQKSGQKINYEILKNIKIKNIYPIKPSKLLHSVECFPLPPSSIICVDINQMPGKFENPQEKPIIIYPVNPQIIDSLALAQHNGLPTRLLDWTIDSRIAACFALYQYLSEREKGKHPEYIAIYALNPGVDNSKITMHTIHDRYNNKFLHAQSGIFSDISLGDYLFLRDGKWPSIESIYREYKDFEIRKFTIPVKECKNLLQKLESCDISISKIMPDYKHSAEEVRLTQNYL